MIATLQQIINLTWQHDSNNIDKLARWIRCLFTLALTSNVDTAEQLLGQAVNIAERSKQVRIPVNSFKHFTSNACTAEQQSMTYPAEELEWLTTTTFNRAIDFYCSSQDTSCRRWAEKALLLSSLLEDGGALHEVLQGKYQGLSWHQQ